MAGEDEEGKGKTWEGAIWRKVVEQVGTLKVRGNYQLQDRIIRRDKSTVLKELRRDMGGRELGEWGSISGKKWLASVVDPPWKPKYFLPVWPEPYLLASPSQAKIWSFPPPDPLPGIAIFENFKNFEKNIVIFLAF